MKKIFLITFLTLISFQLYCNDFFTFNNLTINNNIRKEIYNVSYNMRIIYDINTVFILEDYRVIKSYTILNNHNVNGKIILFIRDKNTHYYLFIYDNMSSIKPLNNSYFYILK